jgi:hypothetical protein
MELDSEARRLLELTREGRTPSARDKLRVQQLLARSLGLAALSAATGTSGTAVAKSATAELALKWTLGLALPAVVAAGAASYFHTRAPNEATSRPDQRALVVAPTPPAPTPEPREPASTVEAPSAPAAEAPERAEPPRTRQAVPGEKRKASETLSAELDLLHDAQAKWRNGDPNSSLALLATHRQRYPKSVLGLEREALRVLSLCAAGRTAEAKEVARRSFKSAPRSPLRASVEESCAKP